MKVSVIIPVYNVEAYLDRCLASVAGQTHGDLEILLIDDGSTDGSGRICAQWAERDARIRLISQSNCGLGAARDLGLRYASGELVAFVDSDDWVEPLLIERVSAGMAEADIGVCDINYVDAVSGRSTISRIRLEPFPVSPREVPAVINRIRTFAWGKIYRKSLFMDNGLLFPPIAFEDVPTTPVAAALAERVAYVPGAFYNYYRNRPGSLSNQAARAGDLLCALELLCQRLEQYTGGQFDGEQKKILIGQLRFACRKWGDSAGMQGILGRFAGLVGEVYPQLRRFCSERFYAEDKMLLSALDKVTPRREQITGEPSRAELCVVWKGGRLPPGVRGRVIEVPADWKGTEEDVSWSIAEFIMEQL